MKIFDPLEGFKVASGLHAVHFAYLIICLFFLPEWQTFTLPVKTEVDGKEEISFVEHNFEKDHYENAYIILTVCHAVSSVLAIASRKLVYHGKFSLAAICEIITIIDSQTAIFYCQAALLDDDKRKDDLKDLGLDD